jgi:hypothetical protein
VLQSRLGLFDRVDVMWTNRPALFKGRHFEAEIIILCVRRYLRFSVSYRDLKEIMAERNLAIDHVTIWRWVQRDAPELTQASFTAKVVPPQRSPDGALPRIFRR